MPSNNEYHGGLEVAPQSIATSQETYYHEKQVTPGSGLETSHVDKYIAYSTEGLELASIGDTFKEAHSDNGVLLETTQAAQKTRWKLQWWIAGGVVLLVVIIAAVVGGLAASRKASSATNATDPSPTATPSSPNASTTVTPGVTAAPFIQHSIGAVGYSPQNRVFLRRLFYLDSFSQIIKAAQQWGNPSQWVAEELGVYAKAGTPLAVAITRHNFAEQADIFYLDNSSTVRLLSSASGASGASVWQKQTVPVFKASPITNLAATWTQCQYCSNGTIMAYQDESNNIVIANYTASKWTTETLELNVMNGTGLALHALSRQGQADQINLFRQTADGSFGLSNYKPDRGWSLSEQTYRKIPAGAQIAAASYGNFTSGGLQDFVQVMSINQGSLEMDTWSSAKNDWLQQGYAPAAMSIETGPGTQLNFSSICLDELGSAYAIGSDGIGNYSLTTWDVADDGVTWTKNGTVSNISWSR